MGNVSLISSFLCFSTYMNYANVRQRACTRDIQYTCRAQGFSICICSIPVNAAEQDVTFFFFKELGFVEKILINLASLRGKRDIPGFNLRL